MSFLFMLKQFSCTWSYLLQYQSVFSEQAVHLHVYSEAILHVPSHTNYDCTSFHVKYLTLDSYCQFFLFFILVSQHSEQISKCLAMLKSYNIYHVIGVRHCSLIKLCFVGDTNIPTNSPFKLRLNGPKLKHHNWM